MKIKTAKAKRIARWNEQANIAALRVMTPQTQRPRPQTEERKEPCRQP